MNDATYGLGRSQAETTPTRAHRPTAPRSAPAVRRSTSARSIPRTGSQIVWCRGAALVDQLYETLMRSSECVLASRKASIGGGC